jgi:hypothetical protein
VLGFLLLGACGVSPVQGPAQSPAQTPAPVPAARPAAPATSAALPPVDCASGVRTGPLPAWARGGFTDDGSSFRHVEGLRGSVVGVLFGDPLSAPPRPDRANKILWVAQDAPAGARITIRARLEDAGPVVEREVGFGGGQSVVDLPEAGCWRLTLTWGEDLTDVVDLAYVRPPR